jgi:hypothetical protein
MFEVAAPAAIAALEAEVSFAPSLLAPPCGFHHYQTGSAKPIE